MTRPDTKKNALDFKVIKTLKGKYVSKVTRVNVFKVGFMNSAGYEMNGWVSTWVPGPGIRLVAR